MYVYIYVRVHTEIYIKIKFFDSSVNIDYFLLRLDSHGKMIDEE